MKKITTLLLCMVTYLNMAQLPVFVHSVDDFITLTEFNGKTFFIAEGNNLWSTQGDAANTQSITSMGSGSAYIWKVHGGKMYIRASVALAADGTDEALYISDGTANGTVLLKDGFKNIHNFFMPSGNLLFFKAEDAYHGAEWWVTDGTTEGTHMTRDINPGTPGQNVGVRSIAYQNKLYFIGYTETGEMDFWVSDGTEAGTYMLAESDYPGAVPLNYDMVIYNDKIFFTFHTMANGIELWVSDGTVAGTHIFKDCSVGTASSYAGAFQKFDDKLLFVAYNSNDDFGGTYLWSTDGTEANTVPVKKVTITGTADTEWINYNGLLYFVGNMDNLGLELCVTDGTTAGTHAVKDIRPGTISSFPERLAVANNKLFFFAADGTTGTEPWVTDGTSAGTVLLKDICPGTVGSLVGNYATTFEIGGKAYFVAKTGANNQHLFASDGTAAGTVPVAPANATVTFSPLSSGYGVLYKMFGALYFEANYTSAGDSLYRLGTPALSTDPVQQPEGLIMYPNPVKDILTVESSQEIMQVNIYNTLGQKVLNFDGRSEVSASLNVAALPAGYYIAEVIGTNTKSTRKILKN